MTPSLFESVLAAAAEQHNLSAERLCVDSLPTCVCVCVRVFSPWQALNVSVGKYNTPQTETQSLMLHLE